MKNQDCNIKPVFNFIVLEQRKKNLILVGITYIIFGIATTMWYRKNLESKKWTKRLNHITDCVGTII